MLLGAQGIRIAPQQGVAPEWSSQLIAHADAVVPASDRLQAALEQALAREPASQVELVFAEVGEGNQHEVVRRRLLPLDLDTLRRVQDANPVIHLTPQHLLDQLIDEYLSARLVHALLHSHCAENLARLQAMAAAHDNVNHMTEDLAAEARRLRQEAITEEIMELAAGLQALNRSSDSATEPAQTAGCIAKFNAPARNRQSHAPPTSRPGARAPTCPLSDRAHRPSTGPSTGGSKMRTQVP